MIHSLKMTVLTAAKESAVQERGSRKKRKALPSSATDGGFTEHTILPLHPRCLQGLR